MQGRQYATFLFWREHSLDLFHATSSTLQTLLKVCPRRAIASGSFRVVVPVQQVAFAVAVAWEGPRDNGHGPDRSDRSTESASNAWNASNISDIWISEVLVLQKTLSISQVSSLVSHDVSSLVSHDVSHDVSHRCHTGGTARHCGCCLRDGRCYHRPRPGGDASEREQRHPQREHGQPGWSTQAASFHGVHGVHGVVVRVVRDSGAARARTAQERVHYLCADARAE